MNGREILSALKKTASPVIIFGAGVVGKLLLDICNREGINVICFCDNSEKVARSDFCGKRVIFFPNLKEIYPDAIFLLSVAAIKDVVEGIYENGYTSWYPGGVILHDLYIPFHNLDVLHNSLDHSIDTCILCQNAYLHPKDIFLRSVDLIITERCSLRCKDCANLSQYYEKPKDVDLNLLLQSIDAFFLTFDGVIEFRLLGGEAFLNKNWPVIVEKLIPESNVKRIVIYTNGTLIPDWEKLSSLQNDKVLIIITDYGPISRKISNLSNLFDEKKIAFRIISADEWLDCASIKPHNRSDKENIEIFKECCAKNIATLSDGKLFRCPYAANAGRLCAVPDFDDDYVDIMSVIRDHHSIPQIKNKVREYLDHKLFLKTCDFCNGRPLSGKEVEPAVQLKNPREYYKY